MKRKDILFIVLFAGIFLPLIIFAGAYNYYAAFSKEWAFLSSFLKFALLATMGEMLGMRIRTGKYYTSDFGLLPRAIVWGFLGIFTKAAFMIFSGGVPVIAEYAGMSDPSGVLSSEISVQKVLLAFLISFFLNIIYAPVLMITHKVTDNHIMSTGGTVSGFLTYVNVTEALKGINWDSMWGFVLRKTIPLFWIPAHTITFLLPSELQILFAALLSTVLGMILAFASRVTEK